MLDIYKACCNNVKELKSKRRILNKLINRSIKEGSDEELYALTKLYALLYSSYAEVSFLKLIHTPYGFSESEIAVIQEQRNLEEKWQKCFELAFQKMNQNANLGEIANKRKKLKKILDMYIIQPSQIRNKIAHGQWKVCLNNKCDSVNHEASLELQQLDCVRVDILFDVYEMFQQCIEDIIESLRTHYRDYYLRIEELEQYIDKTKNWNLESKRQKMRESQKWSSGRRIF